MNHDRQLLSEFKTQLEQLNEVILSALAFWAVWNQLRLHDPASVPWSLERQNQLLGQWKGFFTPVIVGLQRMAMLELAKIFDGDPRTVSLRSLLRQAQENPVLVPHAQAGDLDAIAMRLEQSRNTLDVITKLRNQRFAHADANPASLPGLPNTEIDKLFEDVKLSFNVLSVAHDRNSYEWEPALETSRDETRRLLALLSAATQYR